MAVARGRSYILRRYKDDRSIIWGRRARRLGKHPLGEFTASASHTSLTGITVVDEGLTLASGGNVYALSDIPYDRFYTREWDSNRALSSEDTLISGHASRDAVVTGMNVIFGHSLSSSAPTELADYKPDLADKDTTYMSGQRIDLTPSVATASKAATMIIWDRPTGETWPAWLTIESDITGRVTGTAPAWDGTTGDGTTDDYEFCLKAGNPFGQAATAKWMIKVKENTFTTPWDKAIESDTTRDRMIEWIADGTALSADALANPCARNTNGDGRGWTVAMVWYDTGDGGVLWSYANNHNMASLTGVQVTKHSANGNLVLQYGHGNYQHLEMDTTSDGFTMSDGNWYGLCWTFDGGTTGRSFEDVEDYYGRFKFYTVDLDSTHTVTERATSNSHDANGYDGAISGEDFHLSIGSRYGNSNCIAGKTAFFGMLDTCLTSTSDIQQFVTDPMSYKADNSLTDGMGNKIWLMGDGTDDEWNNTSGSDYGYIRNQVDLSATGGTMGGDRDFTLEGQTMGSDDLVVVTVPSLGN